ncbi:MAG TPA: L-histidine N(alpha)-methyltransferase [Myxococcaceae bacterium]|nr:L-histidine N(alpha)-methyltransferase [Myxococcaceae bacterium]
MEQSTEQEAVVEGPDPGLIAVVREGLSAPQKTLPPWLLYDTEGSRIFEAITRVEEYYPTRVEREIFRQEGEDLVARASGGNASTWVELGAGTARKTQVLLDAAVRRRVSVDYVPVDVSPQPLAEATVRLSHELPSVHVQPVVGDNLEAVRVLSEVGGRRVVLFIGSSIGNYEADAAVDLLRRIRAPLAEGDALVLSTDLRKPLEVLLPAYDDASGVTAAFNLNLLTRLNRELGADFDRNRFRHRARWNEEASRIEMHLESLVPQTVHLPAAELTIHFDRGETLHTESSHKYGGEQVQSLLREAGFRLEHPFVDPRGWYAVNLARV